MHGSVIKVQYSCNYPQKRRINHCVCPPLFFCCAKLEQNSEKL
nr:MAG TPA: hypothetical protein [Caudoviricetes sp.]